MKNNELSNTKNINIQNLTRTSIFFAILIISSKIAFPTNTVPFTLQVIVVMLISLYFNLKTSVFIILSYILLGLLGLPIFASGGGFSYIYNPSFGFIIGFLLSSIFITLLKNNNKSFFYNLVILFLGLIINYLTGYFYMYFIMNIINSNNYSFIKIFKLAILPFILFDFIKLILALKIYKVIKNIN